MNGLESNVKGQIPKTCKVEFEAEKLPYMVPHNYITDFKVTRPDGSVFYIEVKGFFRIRDQVKMRAVKKAHPDKDIRFLFAVDNKVQGSKVTTCSKWAERYGFPYAIGKLPKEWFSHNRSGDVHPRPSRVQQRKSKPTRKASRRRKA